MCSKTIGGEKMARKLTELRKIRRLRDMTQEELAERSGLSLAAVHKAETGAHSPRLVTLEAFARALDVSVQDLLPQPHDTSGDHDLTLMRDLEPA